MKNQQKQLDSQSSGTAEEFNFCGLDHIPYYEDPALSENSYGNWDEYQYKLKEIVLSQDASDAMLLIAQFDDNKDYLNLDDVFLHAIESHPQYPTVELFTNQTRNELHIKMLERCFNAQKIIEDKSIQRAYDLITDDFKNPDSDKFIKAVQSSFDSFNNQEWFLIQLYMFLFFDWETKDVDEKRFKTLIRETNAK